MTKSILLAAATLVTAVVTGLSPASAGTLTKQVNSVGDVTYRTTVSYADLDLRSPEGRTSLRHRLAHAQYEVCANHAAIEQRACQLFAKKNSDAQLAAIVDQFNSTQVAMAEAR